MDVPGAAGLQLRPEPPGSIALPEPDLNRGIGQYRNRFHIKIHGRMIVDIADPDFDPLILIVGGEDAGSLRPIDIGAFKVDQFAEPFAETVPWIRKGVTLDSRFHVQMEMRVADGVEGDIAS